MKQRHLLLVVLCTVMLLAVPATAKENMTGRFGVGGGSTLLGNGGLQVKYFAGHMGISMLVSYLNGSDELEVIDEKGEKQTGDATQNEADISLRLTYNVARAKDTHFLGGLGFTYGTFSTKDVFGNESSWNEWGVEIIIGLEHFFGNHFSLTFETGVPMRFYGEDGPAIGRLTSVQSMLGGGGAGAGGTLKGGQKIHIGGITPTLASTFNFYF